MKDFATTTTLIYLVHWMIVIGLSVRVIMRRRPAGASLAWLGLIISIPFAGAFVYLLIGENRLGEDYMKRGKCIQDMLTKWQSDLREHVPISQSTVCPVAISIRRHAEKVIGFPVMEGNALSLITDFKTFFESIISDINGAKSSVNLEFYIWEPGGMADDVGESILRAVERGVVCRVIVDAVGSKVFMGGEMVKRFREAGIEVLESLPVGPLRTLIARADLRNHRKIAVLDGKLAYTGSQNLVDPRYFKQDEGVGQWIDAMIRIEGPAVEALGGTFFVDWELESETGLELLKSCPDIFPVPSAGKTAVQVVPSGPGYTPEAIHQLLLTTIYTAQTELVLTTPYFVPDDALLTALISAGLRGVDVTIIVPEKVDSKLVHYASRSFFDDLMSAGVRIAGFQGGLLHTKSITIDGEFCVFGSVNLDMRSLWLDFEISLFIYDKDFTEKVRAMQKGYLENCLILDLEEWRKRPPIRRFIENAAHLAGPLL